MKFPSRTLTSCISAVVATLVSTVRAEPATDVPVAPTSTQPATQPARTLEAKISPEARKVLDEMKTAYAAATSLDTAGTITLDTEISGKKEHQVDQFTGLFTAPNKFRHEMKGNMIAGSNGEKAYVLDVEQNAYIQKDAPKERVNPADAPKSVWDVVTMQNPSLSLALARDASTAIIDGATSFAVSSSKEKSAAEVEKATEVKKLDDVKIDDKPYTALSLTNTVGTFTFVVDPESHLLRRETIDQAEFFKHIGQPDVRQAMTTVDYTSTKVGTPLKAEQFAWAAPAGSKELTGAPEGEGAAMALVGKPAPDFKLKDLKGNDVILSEQKGSVVVVDFWATWCGPCVESLPHLNKLYEEKKAAGLKVFAVSEDDDKDKVPPFVAEKKLGFTVVIDSDEQKVGDKFSVQGIPQTVVIGKDGIIKKVFIGFGPGSEEQLKKVVEEAMKN